MTRVFIVASAAVTRAGLQAVLQEMPDIEVVGAAPSLDTIPAGSPDDDADAVVLDIEGGAGHLGHLLFEDQADGSPLVVLANDPSGELATEALHAGGHAVLPRDASPEEIGAAIRAVRSGLIVLHPSGTQGLLPLLERSPVRRPEGEVESLTPREIEILGMLAEGTGNKQIARQLGISEHTVKFHVGSILAKLGATSRTEAVTTGLRRGLIMV